jgi:oligopeptide/dipeptide ABC transporter ATP-binding protein
VIEPTDGARAAPLPTEEPMLVVEGLTTTLATERGPVRVVDDVSFVLARGHTLGVVGESGSGKTMLVRSVMGLLPRSGVTREGSVRFDGIELTTLAPKAMRGLWGARLAMVFQDPMTSLNPVLRIGTQITETIRVHADVSARFAEAKAIDLLRQVRVPDPKGRLRAYPHELSGGLRQRVCLAVALAADPVLLFADEPTTALDVTVQAQVLDVLGQAQEDRRMSIVLVTHDLGVVAGRTDELMVLYAGQVVERGPTNAVFARPRMPYTAALLASIPHPDGPSHRRLATISGAPPELARLPQGCRFTPRCPYAQARCRAEEPPLGTGDDDAHAFRCWFPLASPRVAARPGPDPEAGS